MIGLAEVIPGMTIINLIEYLKVLTLGITALFSFSRSLFRCKSLSVCTWVCDIILYNNYVQIQILCGHKYVSLFFLYFTFYKGDKIQVFLRCI